jgi:hypothetical protein
MITRTLMIDSLWLACRWELEQIKEKPVGQTFPSSN